MYNRINREAAKFYQESFLNRQQP